MADATTKPACGGCGKTEADLGKPVKRCAKCQGSYYCSRECQKKDWKQHKKVCAASASTNTSTPASSPKPTAKNLDVVIEKPFSKIEAKKWLHDRSHQDVYKLLIDSYRLRIEDDYKMTGDVPMDSLYDGAASGAPHFRKFLARAEKKNPTVLPPWWSPQTKTECLKYGRDDNNWSNLQSAVEKSDIVEHYGNSVMPMQLRMLAEQVYGSGPGGQDGSEMLKFQLLAESGRYGAATNVDMSGLRI